MSVATEIIEQTQSKTVTIVTMSGSENDSAEASKAAKKRLLTYPPFQVIPNMLQGVQPKRATRIP